MVIDFRGFDLASPEHQMIFIMSVIQILLVCVYVDTLLQTNQCVNTASWIGGH